MNRLKMVIYVGPVYEVARTRYNIDYVMVPVQGLTFFTPRGSQIEEQSSKRPPRKRQIKGVVDERCKLFPSQDTFGRRDCVEMLPVLSDMERDYISQREHMLVTEDASGELLGLYGLHETLEAIDKDLASPGEYRAHDHAMLESVKECVQLGLKHGLRYGMPMRVTFVQTN